MVVFMGETFGGLRFAEINGRTYINTTPHPINFDCNGEIVTVPPSGVVINASPKEEVVAVRDGVELVRTVFVGTPEGHARLDEIEEHFPGAFVVGSIIAAQAYPGRVLAMVPAPGFERVPPDQKRMRLDKFTVY
ncbi:hypothetical protein [Desulfofundulus sp.]|uniref:hypothetical protein n=1 Tax=Desulfofundulus sp. TaxID=2282750 RepID=UPI003C73AB5F